MNDDMNIWHVRELSGLVSKLMQICKYCYFLTGKWSLIILYWKYTQKWGFVSTTLVLFDWKWCFKPGEWLRFEALTWLRWDTIVAYFDFNLLVCKISSSVYFYVSSFTSSCQIVNSIYWLVVCSVDKQQRVNKALAYCKLNVSAVQSALQSYSIRFSVLFLFPEIAQLQNMLKEIILCIGETEFVPLPRLFPLIRQREEEEVALEYSSTPQLSLSTDMKHM